MVRVSKWKVKENSRRIVVENVKETIDNKRSWFHRQEESRKADMTYKEYR